MTTYTDIVLHDTSNNYFIPYGLINRLGDVDISNPTTGQNLTYDATNQVWKNTSTSATVAWGGVTGNLSDQTDLTNALNGKQDSLVSGTNIKTINNTSLLGSGDISVPTSISDLTDDTAIYPIDKAESVVDNNSGSLTFWSGTKAEYDAIVTKDANTLYNVEDTTSPIISILDSLYPVGSIYIGTMSACPLQTLGIGTWQLVATDKVLQGAGTRGSVGNTLNESLPNIKGSIEASQGSTGATSGGMGVFRFTNGAFTGTANYQKCPAQNTTGWAGSASNLAIGQISLNASNSSSTYQDNAPVQQDAYLVNIWERIS